MPACYNLYIVKVQLLVRIMLTYAQWSQQRWQSGYVLGQLLSGQLLSGQLLSGQLLPGQLLPGYLVLSASVLALSSEYKGTHSTSQWDLSYWGASYFKCTHTQIITQLYTHISKSNLYISALTKRIETAKQSICLKHLKFINLLKRRYP